MEAGFPFDLKLQVLNPLDIEDMLKTIAFIKGHKWTTMMIKRVYFGNWLRDYSQAVDVGSLKGVNGWSFLPFILRY